MQALSHLHFDGDASDGVVDSFRLGITRTELKVRVEQRACLHPERTAGNAGGHVGY
jgi:hypothetical protein